MDELDQKLSQVFDGKVVRKELVHRIKKGTNVPTFVLEFLLARYCASDEEAEIQAGLEAVLDTTMSVPTRQIGLNRWWRPKVSTDLSIRST